MTEELIIDGQHVDLSPQTPITLEFSNNILGTLGTVKTSHSYTFNLPHTEHNAKVLDFHDAVAYDSSTRGKYLSARYYVDGLDLIGDATAYVEKTDDKGYQVVLIWGGLEALQNLIDSDETLNDLPDLPLMRFSQPQLGQERGGALYADYRCEDNIPIDRTLTGLFVSIHPSMRISNLLTRVFNKFDVHCVAPLAEAENVVLLAAPDCKPNEQMGFDSGVWTNALYVSATAGPAPDYAPGLFAKASILGSDIDYGWDHNMWNSSNEGCFVATTDTMRIRVNMAIKNDQWSRYDYTGAYLCVADVMGPGYSWGAINTKRLIPLALDRSRGVWYVQDDFEMGIQEGHAVHFAFMGMPSTDPAQKTDSVFPYDDSYPALSAYCVRDVIDITHDDRFPLQGNLPDIDCWAFVKTCMALFGWALYIRGAEIELKPIREILKDFKNAIDWTDKSISIKSISMPLGSEWAQLNEMTYKRDDAYMIKHSYTASLRVDDASLKKNRNYIEFPFAGSSFNFAPHYTAKKTDEFDEKGWPIYEVTSQAIEPRVFTYDPDSRTLSFTKDLWGEGLISKKYNEFQRMIENPVGLEIKLKLSALDIKTLDLSRLVYLSQTGRYYLVLSLRASADGESTAELIQIA